MDFNADHATNPTLLGLLALPGLPADAPAGIGEAADAQSDAYDALMEHLADADAVLRDDWSDVAERRMMAMAATGADTEDMVSAARVERAAAIAKATRLGGETRSAAADLRKLVRAWVLDVGPGTFQAQRERATEGLRAAVSALSAAEGNFLRATAAEQWAHRVTAAAADSTVPDADGRPVSGTGQPIQGVGMTGIMRELGRTIEQATDSLRVIDEHGHVLVVGKSGVPFATPTATARQAVRGGHAALVDQLRDLLADELAEVANDDTTAAR